MRLHIYVVRPEKLLGAFDGKLLDFIGEFASTVLALSRISFGIFVGKD